MLTKEEWLAKPWIVRWWLVTFCAHPFAGSEKIGAVYRPHMDQGGFRYVVNVRQCGRCGQYFTDAGLERVGGKQ